MIKTGLSILKIRIGNFLSLPYHPNSESVKCPIFLTRIVIDKEINVHICFKKKHTASILRASINHKKKGINIDIKLLQMHLDVTGSWAFVSIWLASARKTIVSKTTERAHFLMTISTPSCQTHCQTQPI